MGPATWSKSVVITLALGAGCEKADAGPSERADSKSADSAELKPTDAGDEKGDEAKGEDGKVDDDWSQSERIEKNPDGTCTRYINVRCPEGVMCNPPPPEQVDCPPDAEGGEAEAGDPPPPPPG